MNVCGSPPLGNAERSGSHSCWTDLAAAAEVGVSPCREDVPRSRGGSMPAPPGAARRREPGRASLAQRRIADQHRHTGEPGGSSGECMGGHGHAFTQTPAQTARAWGAFRCREMMAAAAEPKTRPPGELVRPSNENRGMPRQRTHNSLNTDDFPSNFPERLVRFKEASGLSWAEMARRLGTHPQTIRRWRDEGVGPTPCT